MSNKLDINGLTAFKEKLDAKFSLKAHTHSGYITEERMTAAAEAAVADAVEEAVADKADLSGATFTGDVTVPKIITTTGLEIY